jgi:phage-related minor tail protein
MASAVIGALRVNLGIDTAQFSEGLKGVRASLQRVGKQMQNWGASLSTAITAPLALAGGAVAAAAATLAKDVDELRKAAQISNVGFEEFQKLAYAAKSVGIEGDKLADIFKDVNDRVGDFNSTGGGPMKDFFEQIGPKVGIAADAFKDLSGPQALQLYYDSLKKAGVSQQQMTFYLEAMASDATALIPLLDKGGEGFRKLGEGAAVISDEQAVGLKAYNDAMRGLSEAVKGLTIALASSGILDFVTGLVNGLSGFVKVLAETNPEILQWGVVVGGLVAVIGPAIASLGLFLTVVSAISVPVLAAVGGVTALAGAAIALYANWEQIKTSFPLIGTVVQTTAEVMKVSLSGLLENARLMATGIAQILTGDFAGAWASAQALVNNFWQTFGSIADTIIPGFSAKVTELVQKVSQLSADIVNAFMNLPAQMIAIGGQIVDGLWQGIQAKWETVKAGVTNLGNSIVEWIKSPLDIHSPSQAMHEVGEFIMQGLNNGMQSVDVKSGVLGVANDIESSFQGIGSSIGAAISGTKEWSAVLKDILKQVASSALSGFGGGGGGGFGGLFSGLIGGLFGFARGGTILPGGSGGVDSQLVAFRKSPNERVDITKPGQALNGSRSETDVRVFVDQNGNWQAEVERLADGRVSQAAPAIVRQSNSQVVPTMARYQNDKAGGDWRNV